MSNCANLLHHLMPEIFHCLHLSKDIDAILIEEQQQWIQKDILKRNPRRKLTKKTAEKNERKEEKKRQTKNHTQLRINFHSNLSWAMWINKKDTGQMFESMVVKLKPSELLMLQNEPFKPWLYVMYSDFLLSIVRNECQT